MTSIWKGLQGLRSTATFLMTGAHPDDEWNGFLAWLAYGRGVRTVYACATRGEGGQNALGPERGRMLAAIRSREMELAAREIDLAVHWLGAGPTHGVDDPVFDFGFSKSGEDALRRWGRERLVERLVRVIRAERPDAVSPTFLDVPGQHGHHRAVTQCTIEAVGRAADTAYRAVELPVWSVAKVYLPAFSGAGGSYDDEVPPPGETVRVDLGEQCAVLGESWAAVGERSRKWHASQGMGREIPDGPRPLPLHLLAGVPDAGVPMDGMVHGLGDLAAGVAGQRLRAAEAAIGEALAAYPDVRALRGAEAALAGLEVADADVARRIGLKRRQLRRVLAGVAEPPASVAMLRDSYDPLGGNELLAEVAAVVPDIPRVIAAPVAIDAGARVGVVAGAADETLGWLREIGIAAEAVDDAGLEDLGRFDVLIVGVFGFGQRPALLRHRDRVMAWVAAGGSLVTLYHRPGDGWQDGRTPPLPLRIGQPSLRWRVTDPAAEVTVLAPEDRVLCWPNRIGAEDWAGWVRERGLYFACEWDARYTALLAMADKGEAPLLGGLLTAKVGRGRHTHVAIALHHQLAAMVPGGFRLLANLAARDRG